MRQHPPTDPIRARWQPVGDVFPIYLRLLRASWPQLTIIWALVTLGVIAANAIMAALPLPFSSLAGVTVAIIPVAFGTAMAAHRLLWPHAPSLAECLDVASRAFLSVLAVVAVRQVLMTMGFGFMVVPGIAAAVFLLLAPVIVMAEAPGFQQALRRSAERVWPIGWAVLALLFLSALSGLLLLVPIALFAVPLSSMGEAAFEAVVEAGATAAFPIVFTAMGVALHVYLTAPKDTYH